LTTPRLLTEHPSVESLRRNATMSTPNGKRSLYKRFAWLILAGFALATPVIFFGAAKAVRSNSNKVEDWLPAGFKETGELGWFRERFVGDQFVLISWQGCQLGDPHQRDGSGDDPRIEQVARSRPGGRRSRRCEP
jgi:hypothetical protein